MGEGVPYTTIGGRTRMGSAQFTWHGFNFLKSNIFLLKSEIRRSLQRGSAQFLGAVSKKYNLAQFIKRFGAVSIFLKK